MNYDDKKPLILAVDDDESICLLIERVLQDEGYRTISANNGDNALARFSEDHPDMILLDITMPGKSGIEVLREVRRHSSIPIMMITARSEAVTIHQALVAGADDYICKPFTINDLAARVEAKLQRRLQQHAAMHADKVTTTA